MDCARAERGLLKEVSVVRHAAITVALIVCAVAFWTLLSHAVVDLIVMRSAGCASHTIARCGLAGLMGDVSFYGTIVSGTAALINRLRPRAGQVE